MDVTTMDVSTRHPQHRHGLDTLAGYSIVLTSWDEGVTNVKRRELEQVNDPHGYGRALELKRTVLAACGPREHCVIDSLYVCGCRSDRVEEAL